MADDPVSTEADVRAACTRGDYAAAATLAIVRYGGEILAFLRARLRSASDADEVFGSFAEKLWVGLPGFEWRCGLKAWAYRLARNAANDFRSAAHNRRERNLALSDAPLSRLVERVRSTTALHLQTAAKDRVRELRETLPSDDQMLLVLRVDREMDWRDIAIALGADEPSGDAGRLEREAARLRKRFERVKERLRELARAEGLL